MLCKSHNNDNVQELKKEVFNSSSVHLASKLLNINSINILLLGNLPSYFEPDLNQCKTESSSFNVPIFTMTLLTGYECLFFIVVMSKKSSDCL